MNTDMTAGQLTQIYRIAKEQDCDKAKVDDLIETGTLAAFLKGKWTAEKKYDLLFMGGALTARILLEETGTLGHKGWLAKAMADGHLRISEDKIAFLNLKIFTNESCVCAITSKVQGLEKAAKGIITSLAVKKLVLISPRPANKSVVVQVKLGTEGRIEQLPGAYQSDSLCGTHPAFEGLLEWQFTGESNIA